MNTWLLIVLVVTFICIFGYFYLQKYWNDCAKPIAKNIKENVDDALVNLPSLNGIFDKIIEDKITDAIINNLTPYSEQLSEYGITEQDIKNIANDKELNNLIINYVKNTDISDIKTNPKKQDEVKSIISNYVKENNDSDTVNIIKDKIQNSKKPIPSNISDYVGSDVATQAATIAESKIGSNNVDVNKQIDTYTQFSKIPNREQDNLSTGAVTLTYLTG